MWDSYDELRADLRGQLLDVVLVARTLEGEQVTKLHAPRAYISPVFAEEEPVFMASDPVVQGPPRRIAQWRVSTTGLYTLHAPWVLDELSPSEEQRG